MPTILRHSHAGHYGQGRNSAPSLYGVYTQIDRTPLPTELYFLYNVRCDRHCCLGTYALSIICKISRTGLVVSTLASARILAHVALQRRSRTYVRRLDIHAYRKYTSPMHISRIITRIAVNTGHGYKTRRSPCHRWQLRKEDASSHTQSTLELDPTISTLLRPPNNLHCLLVLNLVLSITQSFLTPNPCNCPNSSTFTHSLSTSFPLLLHLSSLPPPPYFLTTTSVPPFPPFPPSQYLPGLTPTFTLTFTPHCLDISSAMLAASCCSVAAACVSLPLTSESSVPSWASWVERERRVSMEVIVVRARWMCDLVLRDVAVRIRYQE